VVTVERGIDPRRYALLCFGGAGGLHAARIATELGITEIVCPRASGVLAALGLVVSPRRRDVQRSVFLAGDDLTAEAIVRVADELAEQARQQIGETDGVQLSATFELRYRGQAFELPVSDEPHADPARLRERFEALHEERYGYHDPGQVLELVTLRVSATIPGTDVELGADRRTGAPEAEDPPRRRATLDGEEIELRVVRGAPATGSELRGPAVVELAESTLLVPPGWAGEVDESGTIHIRSEADGSG
jgi:N-methylhydantoinase A